MLRELKKFCLPSEVNLGEESEEISPLVPLRFSLRRPDGSVAELESVSTKLVWNEQSQNWLSKHLDKTSMVIDCKPWKVKFAGKRKVYQAG